MKCRASRNLSTKLRNSQGYRRTSLKALRLAFRGSVGTYGVLLMNEPWL